jgi:hypothetical protein
MSKKMPHLAFAADYHKTMLELQTPADVFPVSTTDQILLTKPVKISAIWDTGATGSVITPRLQSLLKLFPIRRVTVKGVNDAREVDLVIISIGLPNHVKVNDVQVTVCELNSPGIDMLIGMDIISHGDFAVCNGSGSTLFSFAIPPFDNKINLVDKAEKVNGRKKFN